MFAGNVIYADPPVELLPAEPVLVIPPAATESVVDLNLGSQSTTTHASTVPGCADEEVIVLDSPEDEDQRLSFRQLMREPYAAYRTEQNSLNWLPGGGEDFGWLDWTTDPYLRRGNDTGLTGAFNIHWLSGPNSTPLPPRLYDFVLGYQLRDEFSDRLSYDLFTSVGIFSDFEGSAREGVRFPSHAVGMFHVNQSVDFIFGIDYLDRDDINVLPVVGVSLRDVFLSGLRMDLVFPRPRIDYMLSDTHRAYLAGSTTGGTWDLESNRIITYSDYRLLLGFESASKDGSLSAWEFGYVFGRSLQARGTAGDTSFDDAFVIQWVTRR